MPTTNFIKSETKKLTRIKSYKNASGEVVLLIFTEKLKENVEKSIKEIVDYANSETELNLILTSLSDE